jgi:hypothetical protein
MMRRPELEPKRLMPLGAGTGAGVALLDAGLACMTCENILGRWTG